MCNSQKQTASCWMNSVIWQRGCGWGIQSAYDSLPLVALRAFCFLPWIYYLQTQLVSISSWSQFLGRVGFYYLSLLRLAFLLTWMACPGGGHLMGHGLWGSYQALSAILLQLNLDNPNWWTYLQSRNKDADIDNRLVDTVDEREGGTNWESDIEIIYYHVENK